MRAAQLQAEIGEGMEGIVARNGEAGHLAELAEDEVQRHAGEEPHEHGLGEEIGDEAEAEAAGDDTGEADGDGEGRGDRDALVASRHAETEQGAGHHHAGPRIRADHELPGGAEERVAHRWQDGGIEPRLRRQADDRRIGDGRGQGDGGNGKTGQQVRAEPGCLVAAELAEEGYDSL